MVLAAGVTGGFLYVKSGPEPADLDQMVTTAASDLMDRPVAITAQLRNQIDGWTLICGTATEPDGAALRIAALTDKDPTEGQFESDRFCALAHENSPGKLTEFDFGSTDMPAMDWLEEYDLPPEILNDSKN